MIDALKDIYTTDRFHEMFTRADKTVAVSGRGFVMPIRKKD